MNRTEYRRNRHPSPKWRRGWKRVYYSYRGFAGYQTVKELSRIALFLYRKGFTAADAGLFIAYNYFAMIDEDEPKIHWSRFLKFIGEEIVDS